LRFESGFLIYYYIETTKGDKISRGLVNANGFSTQCKAVHVKPIENEQFFWRRELPARYEVTLETFADEMSLAVSVDRLFRKREDFRYPDFVPLYYRASCTGLLQMSGTVITGTGIAEYLCIDRR
jgi:hypothetical protein